MFAPEDFKQHCKLASSTGVVPRSKLAEQFQKFDTEMLIQFLSHLELAVAIEDPKVLELINQHLLEEGKSATFEKGYLFCPALVRLEVPPDVFEHKNDCEYHFGWMLSCIHAESFFDARFIHILILRLALSLGLAPVIDPDIPALQHHCFVWKTGVCWSTPDGIKILVDVVNKKNVIVLVQAHQVSLELLTEQNIVIRKVVNTAKDYFKSVITEEFLLSPSDLTYPLKEDPQRALFSIKSVAESIVKLKPFVVSADATENIAVGDLLPAEVYSNLWIEILLPLFSESDTVCKTSMSDHFLSILNFSWSKNPAIDRIVCLALNRTTSDNCEETLYSILKCWRDQMRSDSDVDNDVTHGSYKSLRLVLNQISVFADRNPLELAGVQYNDSDEILLPALVTSPDEPTSTDIDPSENVTAVGDSRTNFEESLVNLPPTVTEPSIPGLNTPLNVTDHLRPLTNVLWDVRPRWYHLGIQLNIDQPTLEVIRFDCRDSVDDCFTSVLTHFLKRDRPSPTFSDLVTALQSPPVNQPQLVDRIRELASKESTGDCAEHSDISSPLLQQNISDSRVILVESTHLQRVKNLIWEVRVQWRALAGALGVSHDTVEEIRHDLQCRNDGDRLEVVLTEWMRGGTATVHDLLTALSHHTVNGGHVSRQLRALQGEARLVLGLCETDCSLCLS